MVSQLIKDAPTSRVQECMCTTDPGSCKGLCTSKCRNICPKNPVSTAPGPSSVQSRLLSYIQSTQKTARLGTTSTTVSLPRVTSEVSSSSSVVSKENHVINSTVLLNSSPILAQGNSQPVAPNAPLILNLSQLQGSNGLIILSGHASSPISIINNNLTAVSSADALVTSAADVISTQNLATSVSFSASNHVIQTRKSGTQQIINSVALQGQGTVVGQQENVQNLRSNQAQGTIQHQTILQVPGNVHNPEKMQNQGHIHDQKDVGSKVQDEGQGQVHHEATPGDQQPGEDCHGKFQDQESRAKTSVNLCHGDLDISHDFSNLGNCDVLKSEDQDSLVSLLHPHPDKAFPQLLGSGVGLGNVSIEDMIGDVHDSQHQDMDTSLDMLHSALLELSSGSSTGIGLPDVTQTDPDSSHQQQARIKDLSLSLMDDQLRQSAAQDSTVSKMITSHLSSHMTTDVMSSGISDMVHLDTQEQTTSAPKSPDLSLDNFDILELPDFDVISHLGSTFPTAAVSSAEPVSMVIATTPVAQAHTASMQHFTSISAQKPPGNTHQVQSAAVTMTTNSIQGCTSVASQKAPVMTINCISCKHEPGSNHAGIANITDFSPEWSYAEVSVLFYKIISKTQ